MKGRKQARLKSGGSDTSGSTVVNPRADAMRKEKARRMWAILRSTITDTVNATLKNDANERKVTHGIHHLRTVPQRSHILQAFIKENTNEYFTVDNKAIRIFDAEGRRKDVLMPQESINRLCYITHLDYFVGWTYGTSQLALFNNEFELLSRSDAANDLSNVMYNQSMEELIVCGTGYIQVYVFRFGNRHLIPRHSRIAHEGLADRKLHLVALEDTPSSSQRCFVAVDNKVMVFNIQTTELVHCKHDLHNQHVTAILFFNPLKYLITGSKDGSIKIWNTEWFLQFVFVGHTAGVTCMSVYPWGPLIVSGSKDNTIRVWSLEIFDEVDIQELDEATIGMGTVLGVHQFFTYGEKDLHLWTIEHLHSLHTKIGSEVYSIRCTDHPSFPVRAVCVCKDASVRIVNPYSGNVLTTMFLSPKEYEIVDVAYAVADDRLFVLMDDGDIHKYDTSTNPCTLMRVWPCIDDKESCNYLMMYEYVVNSGKQDTWKSIARAFATKHLVKADSESEEGSGDGDISEQYDSDESEYDYSATTTSRKKKKQPVAQSDKTLLLSGRKDGFIGVIDMATGKTVFKIDAHGVKGVLSIVANSSDDQVVSAGLDNVIKVWRLFPYAEESLAPLLSFYCAQTPLHMCVMSGWLGVAFHEHQSATYAVVVYNLANKARKDHTPADDHFDTITGLACCPRMKLLASASRDGTVRVWSDTNQLVRLVKLNAVPLSISFCDNRGSMLVGIGKSVHKIDAVHYLPKAFRLKQVTMTALEPVIEQPLPYSDALLSPWSREEQKRMKAARAAFNYERYGDVLEDHEKSEVTEEEVEKEKAYDRLKAKREELLSIMRGDLKSSRKRPRNDYTRKTAFARYLAIFYDRPEIELYKEDSFPKDSAYNKVMQQVIENLDDDYSEDPLPGFFPPGAEATPVPLREILQKCGHNVAEDAALAGPGEAGDRLTYPINPHGLIPNSVLLRLLFKPEVLERKPDKDWHPPGMSGTDLDEFRALMEQNEGAAEDMRKLEEEEEENPRVFNWSDDEEKEEMPGDLPPPQPKVKAPKKKKKKGVSFGGEDTLMMQTEEEEASGALFSEKKPAQSDFLSKMKQAIEKPRTPPPPRTPSEEELQVITPDPEQSFPRLEETVPDLILSTIVEVQEPTPSPEPPPPPKVKKEPTKPNKAIKKLVSKPPPPPPPERPPPKQKTPTPPPKDPTPVPPTPPRPVTPLPDYIKQFVGDDWFDLYFPDCTEKSFPRPWGVANIVSIFCKILKVANNKVKVDVMKALKKLHVQEGFSPPTVKEVSHVLFETLTPKDLAPNSLDPQQKQAILTSIEVLNLMEVYSTEFFAELICLYVDGDKELRSVCLSTLKQLGLKDPRHYLEKELDSWDTWTIEGSDRKVKLKALAGDWMDRWMSQFRGHLQQTLRMLKQGKSVQASLGGAPSKVGSKRKDNKALTVTFSDPPSNVVENATYVEALNYFCEIQLQNDLRKTARVRTPPPPPEEPKQPEGPKNTILVLPRLHVRPALVRLGEMNTGATRCHADRETTLATWNPNRRRAYGEWALAPGALEGFVPFIRHPLACLYLNPFPSAIDEVDKWRQEPILITLRTAPKYFLHENSYPVAPPEQRVSSQRAIKQA